MHFRCECGYQISDITDYISYKAHIVADQDWPDLFDRIDEAIGSDETDREKVIDEFWHDTNDVDNQMYQCPKCGCIFICGEGSKLHVFKPIGPVDVKLLQSSKGENWKGMLHAEWKDKKSDWSEHHGYIYPEVNMDYNTLYYDDFDEFEKKYYQMFEELREKNVIRYARLKRNGEELHYWSIKK